MTGICEHEENEREDTAPGGKEMMHSALVLAAAARRSAEINGQARGCRRRAQDTARGPVRCIRALWCVNEHPLQHAEQDKAGAVCLLQREMVSGHRLCSRERHDRCRASGWLSEWQPGRDTPESNFRRGSSRDVSACRLLLRTRQRPQAFALGRQR
jgi:hypothetical protein